MPATLRATGFELVLHIAGLRVPAARHRLGTRATSCAACLERYGSFHASHQPIIYTIELFAQQLQALDRDRAGQAKPSSTEPDEIGLTLCFDLRQRHARRLPRRQRRQAELIKIDHAFVHHTRTEFEPSPGPTPRSRHPPDRLSQPPGGRSLLRRVARHVVMGLSPQDGQTLPAILPSLKPTQAQG